MARTRVCPAALHVLQMWAFFFALLTVLFFVALVLLICGCPEDIVVKDFSRWLS